MVRALLSLAALMLAVIAWWLTGWLMDLLGLDAPAWLLQACAVFLVLSVFETIARRVVVHGPE
jgi:hypothetical protein